MPKREPVLPAVEHYAFFDALGSIVERGERAGIPADDAEELPAYRVALAGLLTLRLLDRWLSAVLNGSAPSLRELQSARHAVQECDPSPVRNALEALIRAVQSSWGAPSPDVGAQAFAYARLLQDEQALLLAADAYMSVVGCAQAASDTGLIPIAFLHMGYCYRTAGSFTEAEQAYARAGAAANQVRDAYHALLSRIGYASVVANRGNLPRAEALLDLIIRDTEALIEDAPALREVLARAKHGRGGIICDRGDPAKATVDLFESIELYTDPQRRTRALMDLATSLTRLGARAAARDALHICLATQPIDLESRWICAINLLDLAQMDGEETVFERWRRDLADVDLPPRLRAYFLLFSGEGLYRFGRSDAARTALAGALVVAERHELNELVIRADDALAAIDRNERLPATGASAVSSPGVAHIADKLRSMRYITTSVPCM
jgi:tetratricopeptide (TPR) repeat protein